MRLREFIQDGDVHIGLSARDKDAALAELVSCLGLPPEPSGMLLKVLERRERMGSTGIGMGVAIPHCRTPLVGRLRVLFGRVTPAIDWDAVDHQPVTNIFLLVAPPIEVSNDYLPVLGRIAQLMKDPDVPAQLGALTTPEQFLDLLDRKSV
jgi:mannitol/fructose-specific phosphotransferase system IIA component (Ntr-type)